MQVRKPKYLKVCKVAAVVMIAIGISLAVSAASTVDYEVETRVPQDERMTRAEFNERLMFAGVFGFIGAAFNYAVEHYEEDLELFAEDANIELYD